MWEKNIQEFRFLSDQEFFALPASERATYLMLAAHELETRQRVLFEQMRRTANAADVSAADVKE
jgi:hypothetical protein